MDKICATCQGFWLSDSSNPYGECRANYPSPHDNAIVFPLIRPKDWCLQWKKKEAAVLDKALGAWKASGEEEFAKFWAEYPRRIGKKAAQKAFQNARDRPRIDDLIESIRKAKASPQWAKDGGQFIPHPATWLNRGQWADVPSETKPTVFEEFLARGERDEQLED